MYGNKSTGPLRSTIIVGKNGKILKASYKVKAAGQSAKALESL